VAGHQHEPHPHRLAQLRQPTGESQSRSNVAAGQATVAAGVPGLDVQQDEVGVREQLVGGPGAEVAGGVERGVQAECLGPVQQLTHERGLQQRFPTADRETTPATSMNRS
jgi:hypothetical protein